MADRVPVTEETLRAAMRDPRYWRPGEPEREAYAQWVTEGWDAFVRGGEGSNGAVHLRAYIRTRNGTVEQVMAHTRADPPGGETRGTPGGRAAPGVRAMPASATSDPGPPSPRPGITASSPTLVIFVGGAADKMTGLVRNYEDEFRGSANRGHRRSAYFSNTAMDEIMARITAEPQETRIVLVGHSWGGDTAAQVAAALGQQGRPVDTLITVDPVGRGVSEGFLGRVRAGSREWVNIRAHGAAVRDTSDSIAALGGRYGDRPRGHATRHIEAPVSHDNFGQLLRFPDSAGASGYSRMLGQ
jgi:pimeloyl-ACP methyl ester carboxylesterase